MQYAVMVRGVDDTFTAYGPVRSLVRAERFAEWFNAQVEKHEDAHPDESSGLAWAYVMELNKLGSSAMMADSGLTAWAANSHPRSEA